MTQDERLIWLTEYLLKEKAEYKAISIPTNRRERWTLYRALVNLRLPEPICAEYLKTEDDFLKELSHQRGITNAASLYGADEDLVLWKGDITTLQCDAIVNAANRQMLGCFCPNHGCIDNAIHTFAGIRLRLTCAEQMKRQGREEETGKAKLTPAFNLPCSYILHTVGPIIKGRVSKKDREQLVSCYQECLKCADENGIRSIAFCCISTGEFHFPNTEAAKIAIQTVKEYKRKSKSKIKVIFNVFQELDYSIYRELLGTNSTSQK